MDVRPATRAEIRHLTKGAVWRPWVMRGMALLLLASPVWILGIIHVASGGMPMPGGWKSTLLFLGITEAVLLLPCLLLLWGARFQLEGVRVLEAGVDVVAFDGLYGVLEGHGGIRSHLIGEIVVAVPPRWERLLEEGARYRVEAARIGDDSEVDALLGRPSFHLVALTGSHLCLYVDPDREKRPR